MKILPSLLLFLTAVAAGAESAHGAHSNEIPRYVVWQVINLLILGAILYKYGKTPIREFFANRQSEYLKQAEKSRAIFQEAEKEYADVKIRLETLNSTADNSIEKAKKDAEDVKKQMIADAKLAATRLKEEAQATAKMESQKTTLKAKNDIVLQALAGARHVLTSDIATQDHQRLQSDFNKNIEAVSQ
jgi:F-type H+-transporting ATPase subunit b